MLDFFLFISCGGNVFVCFLAPAAVVLSLVDVQNLLTQQKVKIISFVLVAYGQILFFIV